MQVLLSALKSSIDSDKISAIETLGYIASFKTFIKLVRKQFALLADKTKLNNSVNTRLDESVIVSSVDHALNALLHLSSDNVQHYYHHINFIEAERLLTKRLTPGVFLFRPSLQQQAIAISYLDQNNRCQHLLIKYENTKFLDHEGRQFNSLLEYLEAYRPILKSPLNTEGLQHLSREEILLNLDKIRKNSDTNKADNSSLEFATILDCLLKASLTEYNSCDTSAIQDLITATQPVENKNVRIYAIQALKIAAKTNATAHQALLQAVEDADKDIRHQATEALKHLGNSNSANQLNTVIESVQTTSILPIQDGQKQVAIDIPFTITTTKYQDIRLTTGYNQHGVFAPPSTPNTIVDNAIKEFLKLPVTTTQHYFHHINRTEAENLLTEVNTVGAFLLRQSSQSGAIAISILDENFKPKHLLITYENNQILDEQGRRFNSLLAYLKYYQANLITPIAALAPELSRTPINQMRQ